MQFLKKPCKICENKPLYLGLSILELSNILRMSFGMIM